MSNRPLQVRIDESIRAQAEQIVSGIGLSLPEAVRAFVTRIACDKEIPMDMRRPNETTLAAMRELEAGGGYVAHSVEELMEQLNADD